VETFNPITQKLFMAKLSRFLWALLPVLGMAALRGKRKRSRYDNYY